VFQKLRHINLLQPRVITGVEVLVDSQSKHSFRYTRIKNYYGNITIKKATENSLDIDGLANEVGKNKTIPFSSNPPLSLVFTGKQVVIKEIKDYGDEDDNSRLLQKTLPGARLSDFYLQTFDSEQKVFTAVIKKSIVDDVLQELKEKGFYVQEVLLGPFAVLSFKEQIVKNKEIQLPTGKVSYQDAEISNISTDAIDMGENFQIGDDAIPFKSMLSFATAFNYFNPNLDITECSIDLVKKERGEIKFGVYQIALLRLFLVLVLFIGMTNFFLGKNYSVAYDSLQGSTAEQQNTYSLFQLRQQELVNRINLLSNTGVSSRGGLSFYADRIGSLIPQSIQLLEFKIVPIKKKVKKGERVELDPSKMRIKGVAPISMDLNEWVLKLDNEDWIGETVIINYSQTDREYPGIFDLEIKLNG